MEYAPKCSILFSSAGKHKNTVMNSKNYNKNCINSRIYIHYTDVQFQHLPWEYLASIAIVK